MVNISVESGKKLKGLNPQADDFFVNYKPGNKIHREFIENLKIL